MQEEATWRDSQRATSKPLWVLLAMLSAAVLLYLLMRPAAESNRGLKHPAVGSRLATLDLAPLTGDPPRIELANLPGKVTLLHFWGTWCEACRMELPHLVELIEQTSKQSDFRPILVSYGSGESDIEDMDKLRADTEDYLKAAKWNLPTYADPHGATRRSLEPLLPGGLSYPTSIILDRQGTIRGVWEGYDPGAVDEMHELLSKLLPQSSRGSDEKRTAAATR